jgi:hypothetical protein
MAAPGRNILDTTSYTHVLLFKKAGSKPLLNLVVQKNEMIQRNSEELRYLFSTATKLETATQQKLRKKKWKTEVNDCNWTVETATQFRRNSREEIKKKLMS